MITFRPSPWLSVLSVLAILVLVLLGNWQTNRLVWKTNLIEAVESRSTKVERPLLQILADVPSLDEAHFTHVYATGEFQHDLAVRLFTPQGVLGVGYFVIVPLELGDGSFLLVNRGFVPKDLNANERAAIDSPEGKTIVEGLVRLPEEAGRFTPEPNLEAGIWYHRDLAGMADRMGLDNVHPVFLDAAISDASSQWPKGGLTRLSFANNHLGYALTWYGLAIALLGVYIAYHIKQGRLSWSQRSKK